MAVIAASAVAAVASLPLRGASLVLAAPPAMEPAVAVDASYMFSGAPLLPAYYPAVTAAVQQVATVQHPAAAAEPAMPSGLMVFENASAPSPSAPAVAAAADSKKAASASSSASSNRVGSAPAPSSASRVPVVASASAPSPASSGTASMASSGSSGSSASASNSTAAPAASKTKADAAKTSEAAKATATTSSESPAKAIAEKSSSSKPEGPLSETAEVLRDKGPDVEQTVAERIERDGKRLGSSTERLVAIQESIRVVQREVLSKVFDMASLKSFYGRHRHEVDEQKGLSQQHAALLGKVGALASQLTEAESLFAQQEREHKEATRKMRADIVAKTKKADSLVASIKAAKRLELANEDLRKSNLELKKQNTQSLENLQKVMSVLQGERNGLVTRTNETRELAKALGGQKRYGDNCTEKLKKIQAEVKAVEALNPENQVLAVKRKGWTTLQQLLKYNAALKDRLSKAKANVATIQSQIIVTNEQHAALTLHGQKQIAQMRGELGQLREQLAYLENTLTGTVLARQAIQKEIRVLMEQIKVLEMRLMSGELAALKANNTRLRSALVEAQVVNQDCEAAMAAAHANVTRGNVTLTDLRQTTVRNRNLATKIARNFLTQIVQAKDKGAAAMERAEEEAMLAESVQQSDCDGVWDKRHPAVLGELERCKTVKDDLAAANAQVASLSSLASSGR